MGMFFAERKRERKAMGEENKQPVKTERESRKKSRKNKEKKAQSW